MPWALHTSGSACPITGFGTRSLCAGAGAITQATLWTCYSANKALGKSRDRGLLPDTVIHNSCLCAIPLMSSECIHNQWKNLCHCLVGLLPAFQSGNHQWHILHKVPFRDSFGTNKLSDTNVPFTTTKKISLISHLKCHANHWSREHPNVTKSGYNSEVCHAQQFPSVSQPLSRKI